MHTIRNLHYDKIETDSQLVTLCNKLAKSSLIAFDTEFVSEYTYWSELGLIQVATEELLAVIDPQGLDNLDSFWSQLAEGNHETVVHAGREELLFSLRAIDAPPRNLFDTQIAAGLVGYDFPAGYSALVYKALGTKPAKGETRTDWRKRPLSKKQLEYALGDVQHLIPLKNHLSRKLNKLQRESWLVTEMDQWAQNIERWLREPRWRRVSGISGLSQKQLAIVRQLWIWREDEAKRQNRPVKRILRDDLIVQMAKRGSAEPKQIQAIRGLDQGNMKRFLPEFAKAIQEGLDNPIKSKQSPKRRDMPSQLKLLGQFLSSALTSICRRAEVAPSIVGTASDVRDLIAYRMGFGGADEDHPPILATGWRAEVVGNVIDDLLSGKLSIRVTDPNSDRPLAFEPAKS